jgi:Family of unknown function (DUF6689)
MPRLIVVLFACVLSLALAAAVSAQGISNLVISGNQATANLDLPGVSADLALSFEQVVGLSAANLGLSAQLVDPRDPGLIARLPPGGLTSVPGAFPVLVRVQPPPSGSLSFSGVYSFGIHTSNLEFVAGTPLRLFSAEDGAAFADISDAMGSGSYRVRGTKGTFSEFLIVADGRPQASVVKQKFDAVEGLLSTYSGAIPRPLRVDLEQRIQAARSAYQAGDVAGAINDVDGFSATVLSNSGTAIPNVWRASGDLVDVAGLLRAAAATLRFSLSLAPALH